MRRRDPLQLLPWACAALVLFVEAYAKGVAVAMTVGACSMAMFGFILAALVIYRSTDDFGSALTISSCEPAEIASGREVATRSDSKHLMLSPVRLEIAADVSVLFFRA